MNYNKVLIMGRIVRDIVTKTLSSGASIANFSVATNRVYLDKNKEKKEETEFHNIVAFGKQAENIAKYLGKGDEVLVEGRLRTTSWEDKVGDKRYRTEIVAEKVEFGQKSKNKDSRGEIEYTSDMF